jgi:hypothetical protein
MKNVYKLFVVLFLLSLTAQTFAQPTFGIKGGLNFANMVVKDDDDTYSDDFKMNLGFQIGGTAEFIINEKFSFEPALLLSTKGFKMTEDEDGYEETMKLNLMYLDIPLNVKAYFDAGGTKVYGLFGPYLGMGLSGKTKYEWDDGDGDSGSESEDVEWGEDGDFKRLDFGLTIGAGLNIKGIDVGLSYNLGLANINPESDSDLKWSHRIFSVTAAYKF